MNQLRFGIHAGQQYVEYPNYVALFQKVESLGLDWASDFDHFLPIQVDPEGPCYDGLTTMAGLAQATRRISLGILVTGVTYRHPSMLANIAATIDHISGGRFELGMGAAWYELEHQQYGIPFPRLGERMDMLEEAIQIVQSLLTHKRTTFQGRHYQLHDALCEPKPLKRLPIWVGGTGEKRTLNIVGRYADGWNTFLMPEEDYRRKLGLLEGYCKDAGRPLSQVRRSLVFQGLLDADAAQAKKRAAERAERFGNTHAPMGEHAIVGTPQECVQRLLPFLKLGVQDFLILARPPADHVTLELLAREVAPAMRQQAGASVR